MMYNNVSASHFLATSQNKAGRWQQHNYTYSVVDDLLQIQHRKKSTRIQRSNETAKCNV